MKQKLPILAAAAMLPACATVKGAASDATVVGKTAVQMVRDIPDLPLPVLPQADPTPFKEATAEVRAYCNAINERWKSGKEQVEVGEQLFTDGQARVEAGQRALREGERRIVTAELAVDEAERDLAIRTGRTKPGTRDFGSLTDPEYVRTLRLKLKNAIDRMERGSDQIAFGASEVTNGQKRMDEGIQRIKQGQTLMAEDDGRCRDIARGEVVVGAPILEAEPES